jgi:5-hydroxyisourate hydrolase-like protein (transthyretin family)
MDMQRRTSGLVAIALAFAVAHAAPAGAQPPGGRGAGRGGRGGPPPADAGQPREARGNAPLAAGTATVSGTVVVAGTGQPARRARVTLNAAEGGGSRTAMTDDEGRYAFSDLAGGRYNLSVSKTGHVGVTYGQTRPGRPGTPIQLTDGQKFAANLQLPRGSVITGTVIDEYGEPTPGTQVRVMRSVMQGGRRTLQQSGSGSTDDRGIYRVFGLQPGDYIVSAVPRNNGPAVDVGRLQAELAQVREQIAGAAGNAAAARDLATRAGMLQGQIPAQDEQATGYAPVYYPGTVSAAQAGAIALGLGEERASVDFQLQRVPMARIDGAVVNSSGQPADNVQITLSDPSAPAAGAITMAARADADGRFHLVNVPPGSYRLIARAVVGQPGGRGAGPLGGIRPLGPLQPGAIRLWGAVDLPVEGRNLTNVLVTLQQGLTVSGRVVFQGTTQQPPSDLTRLRVNLVPADPAANPGFLQNAAGVVDAAGKFTIASVVPGLYRFASGGVGNGWYLDSAVIDGQDSLDVPFEVKPGSAPSGAVITFTDKQAQLSGTITNQRGQPAPEQTLILYPADERFWLPQSRRIRSTRPSTDGQFTFAGIPPGDYKLVAMVDVETGAWFDPTFLQQIDAASTRITVGEGEKKVQNLQISSGG